MYVCMYVRLKAVVTKMVDVSYGGENGFNQAIELASEALANVKFIVEKKLISKVNVYVYVYVCRCMCVCVVYGGSDTYSNI